MQRLQTEDAAGKVMILRDVPYVRPSEMSEMRKQMLDVYLPRGERSGLPLIVHFHGGGWTDGDRRAEMFGAPAASRSHAAAGCVVVTPSYRLGECKALMADAQRAVLWAVANAASLGADPDRIFLSGHSAGGNIAALLALGPWLAPPVLPASTIKGVIGISGVYTLLRPLGGNVLFTGYKNQIFDRYMRKEVFGDEMANLAQHSPTCLARLGGGKETPFKPRLSDVIGKLAPNKVIGKLGQLGPKKPKKESSDLEGVSWADKVPPFVLLNASWDLGLEDDAAYFAKALKWRTGTKPMHHSIPKTNHATVTWDEDTFVRSRDFIAACEAERGVTVGIGGRVIESRV